MLQGFIFALFLALAGNQTNPVGKLASLLPKSDARVAASGNRQSTTLSQYVESLHWDTAKRGPLMVLEPGTVNGKSGTTDLASFKRMRVSLPGLTAIVPNTMVIIDDSMQQSPNMYDGLSRHAKVLYLLTTLDSNQWSLVTGSGLGLSDLTKEQQPVLQSLVPNPFGVATYKLNAQGNIDGDWKPVPLSDSDRQAVRLRVVRGIEFMMLMSGEKGALTPRSTKHDSGKPGTIVTSRDDEKDFKPETSFGMRIRQVVDNVQKRSDLKYSDSRLTASIRLKTTEKIADLLGRIGSQCGLELHADLRVGDRQMVTSGGEAPIFSVLKAVALSVTGTYRKIGPAFELTSDLTGLGTRKLNLALVDDALNKKAWDQEEEWRRQIAASGHLADIKFRPDDQDAPDDNLLKKIQRFDDGKREPTLTPADFNGALRDFIDRQNRTYRTQQVSLDGARANSEYLFSFVLPSGDSTKPEIESLGTHTRFSHASQGSNWTPPSPDVPKIKAQSIALPISIGLIAETATEAEAAVDLASRFGFKDLWLDTLNQNAVTAAVEAGAKQHVPVYLAVRPFDFRSAKDALSADRTLIGDDPPQSLARRMGLLTPQDKLQGFDEPTRAGPISPVSAGYHARIESVANLVRTPGLAGVRLIDVTPDGYNGPRLRNRGSARPLLQELGNFGYTEDLRLAFLRNSSVDPIDLAPNDPRTNADIRQPFFLDDNLRGSWAIYDGTDNPLPAIEEMMNTFDAWLLKINRAALQSMLDAIVRSNPQIPIAIEPIPLTTNASHGTGAPEDWTPGKPIPVVADMMGQPHTAGKQQGLLRSPVTASNEIWVRQSLAFIAAQGSKFTMFKKILLEFPNMDVKQLTRWISETFSTSPIGTDIK